MKIELIYKLVKILEYLEMDLIFSVFYMYNEFLFFRYVCFGFNFKDYYYEI